MSGIVFVFLLVFSSSRIMIIIFYLFDSRDYNLSTRVTFLRMLLSSHLWFQVINWCFLAASPFYGFSMDMYSIITFSCIMSIVMYSSSFCTRKDRTYYPYQSDYERTTRRYYRSYYEQDDLTIRRDIWDRYPNAMADQNTSRSIRRVPQYRVMSGLLGT